MRKYETMMISGPDLDEDEIQALVEEASAIIRREGGNVTGVDIWGLRRLEYPINHKESGHYAVLNFEAETGTVKELERIMGIKDEVLRIKTLLMDRGKE